MSMVTSVASAHDFEVDGIYYRITSSTDQTVAVTYLGDSYDSYSNEYTGKVTIPESVTYNSKTYSVTSIDDDAFSGCYSLTSIEIGSGVTSIGNWAFEDCTGLTDVYCFAADVPVTIYGAFDNVPTSSATLHVPAASIEAYKTTSPWSEFGTIVAIEEGELDIEPMETDTEIAFDEVISEETDLSGVVVENMFITLDQESGDGYLQEEGCLMISRTLTEEQVRALQADGLNIWEVRNGFNGIIMEGSCRCGYDKRHGADGRGTHLERESGRQRRAVICAG